MALAAISVTVLLCAVIFLNPLRPAYPWETDFTAFWTAALQIREGLASEMYDTQSRAAIHERLLQKVSAPELKAFRPGQTPYWNPPPMALILVPVTLLPVRWGFQAFAILSLLAFVVAVALPLRGRPHARLQAFGLLSFSAVAVTILEGQVNGFFLLAFTLGLQALASGRSALGGAVLGLLWLKPQYAAVIFLVLLLKRRWQELGGMAVTLFGGGALSLAMVGPSGLASYWTMLKTMDPLRPPASLGIRPEHMANWRGLVVNLWPDIPDVSGSVLTLILGATTVLLALTVWRGEWDPASPRFARQMLATILATVIAAPHSHFHGTVLLLAPLSLVLASPMEGAPMEWAWRPMLALGQMLGLIVWLFRGLSWLMVPYFLLALGMLVANTQGTWRPRTQPGSGGSRASAVPSAKEVADWSALNR